MPALSSSTTGRRYDLDWLRVGAFGLLIFYHIGMFYVSWDWHVKSAYAGRLIEPAMLLTNPWRLSLLFLVSGAAFRFATDRIPLGIVFGKRTIRLLVPLIFGMFVIVVPQVYFEVVQAGRFDGSFWDFYGRYLNFDQSFDTPIPTWNHLWYIAYLFVYSIVLLPFIPLLQRASLPEILPAWLVLVLPAIPLAIFAVLMIDHWRPTHALTDDWWNHARYFYIFALGFVIPYSARFWSVLKRMTWPAVLLALATYGVMVWLREVGFFDSDLSAAQIYAWRVFWQFEAWFWIAALLGLGYRYLNRPSKVLSYLTEGVYPFYILHQTIIVVLGASITGYRIGAVPEALTLTVGTFFGCWALYEFVIKRVGMLRVLFGLSYRPKVRVQPPVQAEAA